MNKTLDNEVKEIQNYYFDFNNMNEGIVAMNTERWVKLGRLLNDHEKHVLADGKNWVIWVTENLSFLGERRRQQAMLVASISEDKLKSLYSMGIDRLYTFVMKLFEYNTDPELYDILNEFNFSIKQKIDSVENRNELNNSADKVVEYLKFKGICSNIQYDKGLIIDVIKAGSKFTTGDYDEIKKLSTNSGAANNYLLDMLMTGISQSSGASNKIGNESIHVLLAKLNQTIDGYIGTGQLPPYLSKGTVHDSYKKLTWLMDNIK